MNLTIKQILELVGWCLVWAIVVYFLVARKHIFLDPVGITDRLSSRGGVWVVGLLLLLLACYLICKNLYVGYIAPRNHWKKHGSMDGFQFISGIPIVGIVLTLLSALLTPPNQFLGVMFLILIVLDIASMFIGLKFHSMRKHDPD